jgi:hypothetical protein
MNTTLVYDYLFNDITISKFLIGVFPLDKIPIKVSKPAALVINTDISTRPGQHWLAVFIDTNNKGYYFDSYGMHINKKVQIFLKHNCTSWTHNTFQIQSCNSIVCGQYCCVFLALLSRNVSFDDSIQYLNISVPCINDFNVIQLFNRFFSTKSTTFFHKQQKSICLCLQKCCPLVR